jgi:hypothetical protein
MSRPADTVLTSGPAMVSTPLQPILHYYILKALLNLQNVTTPNRIYGHHVNILIINIQHPAKDYHKIRCYFFMVLVKYNGCCIVTKQAY